MTDIEISKIDIHDSSISSDDGQIENTLRPQDFSEYFGQKSIIQNLKMYIEAARLRGDSLDHCLFSGPPGLGKTTLANIVARQMGSQLHSIAAPSIEKKGDLAAILSNLQEKDVLFIDEIHRLPRVIEEVLYGAMEDFKLDIIIGQGPAARTLKIELPRFTLVGATTRTGLLTTPLRDRFGVSFRLDYYQAEELEKILHRSSKILKVDLSIEGSSEIARRSRGTPRIANRLLRRVRDYAQVYNKGTVSHQIAKEGLKLLDVDEMGLDAMDRRILATIIEKFDGGPVGIETISAALSEERDTLEDVYEPFLIQQGLLQRTPKGRVVTSNAYRALQIPLENDKISK